MEGKDWAMHPPHWVAKKLAWTRFTQTVLHNVRVAVELSVAPTPEDRRAVNLLLHDSPALVTRTSMDWYGQLLPLLSRRIGGGGHLFSLPSFPSLLPPSLSSSLTPVSCSCFA